MTTLALRRFILAAILGAVVYGDGDAAPSLRAGQVPPPSTACPYIIPPEEGAGTRGRDASIPGSVIVVKDFNYARLGNRFVALGHSLSLGVCCKSKLVSLPTKDDVLAPGIFNEGIPGPRNFDFSGAPDVDGFDHNSCPTTISWGGDEAFHLRGLGNKAHPFYTPGLSECIKTVPPVTGCEAAYLFPADIDVCLSDKKRQDRQLVATERGDAASDVRLEGDAYDRHGKKGGEDAASLRAGRVVTRTGNLKSGVGHNMDERGDEPMVETEVEGRASNEEDVTGSLVMHVRSGDIFVDPVHPSYGQPPLQYYLRAIEHQKWARVDVVTNGLIDEEHALNPVVPVLEEKVANGELPTNIHFHENRSIAEDLLSMICADGLVTAKSTLTHLVGRHSLATRKYFTGACTENLGRETTKQGVKVFGRHPQQGDYTPYHGWYNTPDQLVEMMTFDVTGFQQCIDTVLSPDGA